MSIFTACGNCGVWLLYCECGNQYRFVTPVTCLLRLFGWGRVTAKTPPRVVSFDSKSLTVTPVTPFYYNMDIVYRERGIGMRAHTPAYTYPPPRKEKGVKRVTRVTVAQSIYTYIVKGVTRFTHCYTSKAVTGVPNA